MVHMFQLQVHGVRLEKSAIEAKHSEFVPKHQEESFRHIESARLLPMDDTNITSNLDKVKMMSWAKSTRSNIFRCNSLSRGRTCGSDATTL
jgi:hypothetical protein